MFIDKNYDYLLGLSNRYVGADYGGYLLNDLSLGYLENAKRYEPICERGELMKYICRSLAICGFSRNSRFYYKYKKHNEKVARRYPLEILRDTDDAYSIKTQEEVNDQVADAFVILNEIRWFDAEVFKSYYLHEHSLRTLSDATGIPKNTLYKSIQAAKSHLQENVQRIR